MCDRTVEHGPVTATDRLEKPRHPAEQQQQQAGEARSSAVAEAVPGARWRVPVQCNKTPVLAPAVQTSERVVSKQPSPAQPRKPVRELKPANKADQSDESELVQVPPSVVRGIVITVLASQGVTQPSQETLDRAIQEYYSKNPRGVTRNPAPAPLHGNPTSSQQQHAPALVQQGNHLPNPSQPSALSPIERFQRAVHSQGNFKYHRYLIFG